MRKAKSITKPLVLMLIAFFLAGFSPFSLSPSEAVTGNSNSNADIRITWLYANVRASQAGLQTKLHKLGYRYIELSWKPVGKDTASRYVIYTSGQENGKYTKLTSVTSTRVRVLIKKKFTCIKVVGYKGTQPGTMSYYVSVDPSVVNATRVSMTRKEPLVYAEHSVTFKAQANGNVSTKVRWTSSNRKVATVTKRGKVKGISSGTATIYAISHNGIVASQAIKVVYKYPKTVTIPQGKEASLHKGDVLNLTANVSKAQFMDVTWSSTNPAVAKVTETGKVTAVASGTCYINVKTQGTAMASFKVNVVSKVEDMVVWAEKIAADDSYGYTMSCKTSTKKRVFNRYCHTCDSKHNSKDYDCASFVTAAVAHGLGDPKMLDYCKWCGGCTSLKNQLLKCGWKNMGKLSVKKLKRGDILINPSRHVEIYAGNGYDVGAHDDYNGKSGDASGREISVAKTWSFYTMVLRLN